MYLSIINNPVAGRGKSEESLPELKRNLDTLKLPYEISKTQYPGHGIELAGKMEANNDTIVAMGGDGTVREVLNGVQFPETKIGIIPAGLGNDFARSLGIPMNISAATETLSKMETKKVDLGSQNGKFFNFMGAGFPAEVVKTIKRYRNRILKGPLIYLFGLLQSVTKLTTYEVKMVLDGKTKRFKTPAIFVANSQFVGGGIKLIPHASITDGLLDVAVISDLKKSELIFALRQVYRGTHVNHPKIDFYRVKSVEIHSEKQMDKIFDGELEKTNCAKIKVAPSSRNMIVPPT